MTDTSMTFPLTVRAQYTRNHSFRNPNPLAAFTQNTGNQPQITVNIQVGANNLGEGNFEVVLDINVEAKREDQVLFETTLSYGAIVSVENLDEAAVTPFVMIEAPHLLFPYARNILSESIRDGGFPPLLLAPVDFAALYRQQQESNTQQQAAQA